jgi:hypothetical protein
MRVRSDRLPQIKRIAEAIGEKARDQAAAPGGELAQVECVRLAGQAAVPGQEPGEGESFGISKGELPGPVTPCHKRGSAEARQAR